MTWELGFDMSLTPQPNTLESSLDWKELLIGQGWNENVKEFVMECEVGKIKHRWTGCEVGKKDRWYESTSAERNQYPFVFGQVDSSAFLYGLGLSDDATRFVFFHQPDLSYASIGMLSWMVFFVKQGLSQPGQGLTHL